MARLNALFLGTYPPRQCGIATFTADLVDAVERYAGAIGANVIAVDQKEHGLSYPSRVVARLEQHHRDSYREMAHFINRHPAEVLNIQHEFGIFGGRDGAWLLDLLNLVRKPVAVTLHTVLPEPSLQHIAVVREIAALVGRVAVLSETARQLLEKYYFVDRRDICVIPHGVPDVSLESTARAKAALGLSGVFILSTFGLLSRGKGLETTIDAMGLIADRHPEALYLILGATHPVVRACEGESYREELQARIAAAGLSRQVKMIDRYFALPDLLEYLAATDVYVTPYANATQVVSGTLAYALGAGKAIVATPYPNARELLSKERGIIVPRGNAEAMAAAFLALIANDDARIAMAARAYHFGRSMVWSAVGRRYAELFKQMCSPLNVPAFAV